MSSTNPLPTNSLPTNSLPTDPPLQSLTLHRQQFPALTTKTYFNYGGQGPLPEQAIESIGQAHSYVQRSGPFSSEVNRWVEQQARQTREAIAAELGAPVDTISLTENVSMGCNIALWGMDWQAGDHLLLSDCEHPSVMATAQEIQHRFRVDVTVCPLQATLNQGDPVQVIADHLRPSTRLVAISHIFWNTGQVLPLQAIADLCHRYPARSAPVRLLVDAAQSVGVLPLTLSTLGADFYAFTGHKWWCGPAGLGGLYVDPAALDSIRPTFLGWRGITKSATGYPTGWRSDAQRFEVATSDFTLFGALQTALATHHQWGTSAQRYQRIQDLSHDLWQRLVSLPSIVCLRSAAPEAGLVSFRLDQSKPGMHNRLVQMLEQQGFLLRTLLDPDCVRACVHYLTLESEIDRLVAALEGCLTQL